MVKSTNNLAAGKPLERERGKAMAKAQVIISQEVLDDSDADASWLEQDDFADRLAEYRAGDFSFVGVRATALIRVPYGKDFIETRISSPGLWGIESDSGQAYFDEVFQEERKTLLEMLESMHEFEVLSG